MLRSGALVNYSVHFLSHSVSFGFAYVMVKRSSSCFIPLTALSALLSYRVICAAFVCKILSLVSFLIILA